uniref:Glycine cleavage system protein H n=1 Tax=Candidatus Desulfatibia profunda TaxID=2841695 RepID=A0A8J6TN03_9BACT|nr:glycine cleavage system protein H [Candidatus Desulfatibia profunda]
MESSGYQNQLKDAISPCIWMQAGVVNRRLCKIDYDCPACRFDRAMRRVSDENSKLRKQGTALKRKRDNIFFWKEKLKELPPWKRPCLHHMKGRIEFKACTQEYRCWNCEFDQFFHDQYSVYAVVRPVDFIDVEGFKIPHGFYLHRGHAWLRIEEGSEVRVGLDDFALRLFGPLDRFEAPLIGKKIEQDRADILMNRGQQAAKVLSPVSGVVTAINPRLREKGSLANQDPYSEGWIARVHTDNLRRDLKKLMIGDETKDFIDKEVHRLYQLIENEAGPLTADGGQLGNDIYGNLPQVGWQRLAKLFLHTDPE